MELHHATSFPVNGRDITVFAVHYSWGSEGRPPFPWCLYSYLAVEDGVRCGHPEGDETEPFLKPIFDGCAGRVYNHGFLGWLVKNDIYARGPKVFENRLTSGHGAVVTDQSFDPHVC